MKSYKKITNYNYMENCKCNEYKEEQATQSSRITCLEYDNEEQLNRIINLEKEKSKLDKTITILNNTIITLNEKIIVLEKDNKEFKIKNNNLEFNKLRIKIITAIQDLNNYEKLEVKFTYPLNTCIANIRVINYLKNNITLDNSTGDLTKHELKNIEWWWNVRQKSLSF